MAVVQAAQQSVADIVFRQIADDKSKVDVGTLRLFRHAAYIEDHESW